METIALATSHADSTLLAEVFVRGFVAKFDMERAIDGSGVKA